MIRVAHVTTVHPRDDIRIFHKECLSLARAGYDVVQVVSDGLANATIGGVRIVDIGARPSGRLSRMRRQPAAAIAALRREQPRLVHLHDPELLHLGVKLAREGVQVIYDAHEDVPRQILTKQWIPAPLRPLLARIFEVYENWEVRHLAGVIAATPHIARRFNTIAKRSVNVSNFPDLAELAPPAGVLLRERAVCYVGGLMRTRGLLQMVRAVAGVSDLRFIVCGEFEDPTFEAELRAEPGWQRVEYLGRVGRDRVREVMARSRVGLVTLLPAPSYVDSLPIKMFEYMSAELPVLASDFPLWRDIVEQHGCGICVDPRDVNAISAALHRILNDTALVATMGLAGRAAVQSIFNWPQAEAHLLALYRDLIGAP